MKVTYSWLKEFVDIKTAPQELADKLTMAGLEVVSLEEKDGDFVFEIEITSNRPDWLSVTGIAREIAAITGKKLKVLAPAVVRAQKRAKSPGLKIEIENKKDCPLYTARIIEGVKVGPSPEWLRKRLELVGCRSVNNVVDITNYVLFAYGQPLHAFDLDKLEGGVIIVRRGRNGEKLITIDGEAKELAPGMLVIADSVRPQAAAGVMGGKDSEVSFATKNILLESAVFDPALIRKSRQALKLQSESAYRFERGVDIEAVQGASLKATELIEQISGGKPVLAKSSAGPKSKARDIDLDLASVQRSLGIKISPTVARQILSSLGFAVKAKGRDRFGVRVPSYRQDVIQEVDLIEELARIYGYENIPITLPAIRPDLALCRTRELVALVKGILLGLGLEEAVTYSLIPRDALNSTGINNDAAPVEIMNPLSREQEILRMDIFPSLCASVALNLNRKQEYVGIFEVAKKFAMGKDLPREDLALSIAVCGARRHLYPQGLVREEAGYLSLKGALGVVFERLGIKDHSISVAPAGFAVHVNNEKAGVIARLSQALLDKFEIKNRDVFVAELLLDKIFAAVQLVKKYQPPPKYPGITRDISILVREEVSAQELLSAVKDKGGAVLREAYIADYYKGKQIPAVMRAMTLSCLYRLGERTLTEEEINPLHKGVCELLAERFSAQIR